MKGIFTPQRIYPDGGWLQPGNTGNTGGGSGVAHGTSNLSQSFTVQVNPLAGDPWDTFYFYSNLPPHPEATRFSQEISFTFPTQADIDACEAVEWELEKCVAGDVWNMGWQMRVGEKKVISVFDYTRQTWVPTNIPLPIVALGIPIKFETEHILSHDREEHTALWINGTRYEQQFSHPMIPQRWPNNPTYLHYSFQLDSKGKGVPFTVKVDIGPTEVL